MNGSTDATPLHRRARTIGIVWLLYFVIGSPATLLIRRLVVSGDAAATATNILAHATAYLAGSGVDLVGNCLYIVLTILLYGLFRPVDRNLALLATTFSLIGCATQIIGGLLRVAPLVLLANNQPLSAFNTQQLQAAALFSLRMYSRVFHISFVLFALFEIVLGYLILRSTFLPRWLGWLFIVAGVAGATFLWPPLATSIFPLILAADVGELILAVWLIVKGPTIDRVAEQRSG